MRRRNILRVLGGTAVAWQFGARSHQKATPMIGYLHAASPGPYAAFVAAFRQGLSETGRVEGPNFGDRTRWAEGSHDRLPALVKTGIPDTLIVGTTPLRPGSGKRLA